MTGSPEMRALAKTGIIAAAIAFLFMIGIYSPYIALMIVAVLFFGALFFVIYNVILDAEYDAEKERNEIK